MKNKDLEILDNLLKNSKLTEEDAERIGNKIKKGIAKRFLKHLKTK